MRRRYLFLLAFAVVLAAPPGLSFAQAPARVPPMTHDPHALLEAILRNDHGSYVAAKGLHDSIEAHEDRADDAPSDLLLLASGSLRGDVRALQEYLRMHGEALPVEVRSRMTKPLARKLSEASKRNEAQEWIRVRVGLDSALHAARGAGCSVRANGRAIGTLPDIRHEVTPGAPQRILVRCPNGARYVSTVVPTASSRALVDVTLSTAETRVLARGAGEAVKNAGEEKESGAADRFPWAGTDRIARWGLGASLLVVGEEARRHSLHAWGLDDGLFPRFATGIVGDRFHGGLSYGAGKQRRASSRGPREFQRVHALSLEIGTAWAWSGTERRAGIEVPLAFGVWRWFCSSRPCGFHKRDPGLSVSTGLGAILPFVDGLRVELAALPGIVVGARPAPFLELRTQVARDH